MKHIKKILVLGMTGVMLFTPANVFAAPALVGTTFMDTMTAKPRFAYDYKETITRTYSSKSDIPETYYYEKYSNDWGCWFRGTLRLQSVKASGKKFVATFTGTMYGSPV